MWKIEGRSLYWERSWQVIGCLLVGRGWPKVSSTLTGGENKLVSSYAEAKIEVERLVDQFASLSTRNRKRYNEAATRQQFILPLFRALGWNIENTREVSPEERVSRGFVDFAFRIRGIPRFFLETKRIPADLEDPRWAHQAINYAWLKGVTWAVLTDGEPAGTTAGIGKHPSGQQPHQRHTGRA